MNGCELFDQLPIPIFRSSLEGKLIYANAALAKLVGYADVESLLRAGNAAQHLEQDLISEVRAQISRNGIVPHFEAPVRAPDGQTLWVAGTLRAVYDEQGSVKYLEGSLEDISQRRYANELVGRKAARMRALADVSRMVAGARLDYETILGIIARCAAEQVGDACVVSLLSEDQTRLKPVAIDHPNAEVANSLRALLQLNGSDGRAMTSAEITRIQEPLLISIAEAEDLVKRPPDYAPDLEHAGARNFLLAPMCAEGQVFGTIGLAREVAGSPYDAQDQQFLDDLADRAGLALSNSRLYHSVGNELHERERVERQLQRRVDEFTALYEITRSAVSQTDLAPLLRTIVKGAPFLLQATCGQVYLYDATSQTFQIAAVEGLPLKVGARIRADAGLAGLVARNREPIIVDDYAIWAPRCQEFGDLPVRSILQVPLLSGEEVIGMLGVCEVGLQTRRFTDDDARLLSLLAVNAAALIHSAQLFDQVRTGRKRLQTLSNELLHAQENERAKVARELHDQIGQTLTLVKLRLQGLQLGSEPADRDTQLEETMLSIDTAIEQVRDLSFELRPSLLDDMGLPTALKAYANRVVQHTGLAIEFDFRIGRKRLPFDVETTCFRVVQEALTNIIRHARARRVVITLQRRPEVLQLTIRDDGVGFDGPAAMSRALEGHSLGILSMQQRVMLVGGRLEIQSESERGALVVASFPLTARMRLERRKSKR
ncbi:MAG: GAF domain-containing protein [Chloroflexi bacterium]|nr:GAF domain-containing protein [Chloroflexota bacterium]